jgi:RNA polymerase sigma-70 factor (ECF subfamily)
MSINHTFADFLSRVRRGDEEAAAALVRQLEPVIRREVRMRLTDPGLYRLVDSVDICQAVLLSFFVRAAAGQFDLAGPHDLCNLLLTMAQNKVAAEARKQRRRDALLPRVDLEQTEEQAALHDGRPGPGRVTEGRDLLRKVLERLSEEERRLAELRAHGFTWPEVTARLGGTSEGRRKQLTRALDRVTAQLGLGQE